LQRIHQRHLDVRHIDREHKPRQTRARTDVDERLCPCKERRVVCRETIDDVFDRHVLRRGERREVHPLVPCEEQLVIACELLDLLPCERHAERTRARCKDLPKLLRHKDAPFPFHHAAPPAF